jgi:hypothetical protein
MMCQPRLDYLLAQFQWTLWTTLSLVAAGLPVAADDWYDPAPFIDAISDFDLPSPN